MVIRGADQRRLTMTHGVAAKIINLYLKARFVCGGYHAHERVQALHPPIDSLLLKHLSELNVGGYAESWKQTARKRWSKFESEDYEQVVALIRESLRGAPLWMIEEHWRGNR